MAAQLTLGACGISNEKCRLIPLLRHGDCTGSGGWSRPKLRRRGCVSRESAYRASAHSFAGHHRTGPVVFIHGDRFFLHDALANRSQRGDVMMSTKALILISIFVAAMGLTYQQIGIVGVCLGAALFAFAACSWIVRGKHAARPTICGNVPDDRYTRNELQILLLRRR
jgi:hypothetical protein